MELAELAADKKLARPQTTAGPHHPPPSPDAANGPAGGLGESGGLGGPGWTVLQCYTWFGRPWPLARMRRDLYAGHLVSQRSQYDDADGLAGFRASGSVSESPLRHAIARHLFGLSLGFNGSLSWYDENIKNGREYWGAVAYAVSRRGARELLDRYWPGTTVATAATARWSAAEPAEGVAAGVASVLPLVMDLTANPISEMLLYSLQGSYVVNRPLFAHQLLVPRFGQRRTGKRPPGAEHLGATHLGL